MSLLAVQHALATVLMQAPERATFAKDPAGTLRRLGLTGKDLRLLATVDVDDLAYFATRRNVDRHQALKADAPMTVALLEATRGRVQAYFRAYPFSLEDPRRETERFAKWCRKAAADGDVPALAPDLATYEAAVLRLMTRAPRAAKPGPKPRRTPDQVRFVARHRLHEALRGDGVPKARAGETYVVVRRVPGDVTWHVVTPLEAALVECADGKRTEAAWLKDAARLADATVADAKAAAAGLRKDGLITPTTKH